MNVGSKYSITWNHSRYASSWRFYLHCGIEETGSPAIICIIYHQVLRHQSEHATSSMGKHLLAKAHIAKLNNLTESEVTELTSSTVDETAFTILKMQGSRGITIVSLQSKFIFDIPLNLYWSNRETKYSKLAVKDFQTDEFYQDTSNRYLMLGFVSAHNPWNAVSNVQLRQSYKALRSDIVLPSAMTLSNICRREYELTVDAIKRQLPSRNKLSIALDGWTSTHKLTIPSVIACYMDWNWRLRKVQRRFDEVDFQVFSSFES